MEEDTPAAIHPLALKIQKLFNKDLVEEYEFLRAQLEVAVEIRGKRYQFTDQQRGTLVKYGEPVKGHLDELCKLMKPETLLRWHRDQKRKKWDYSGRPRKKVGRPPIGMATERLIVEMADEMHSGDGRRERIKPTENEWGAFRMKLDELDVWKWKKKYWSEVCDGTQWELEIKYTDKRIKSDGSNAYPDAPGKPDAGPEQSDLFDEYLKVIRTLIGGRDFC